MKPIQIVIFAKAPLAGFAKTRLIPALGAESAAGLAKTLLLHTIIEAQETRLGDVELCTTPSIDDRAWQHVKLPLDTLSFSEQGQGDLGARMAKATSRIIETGASILLIGSDCPALEHNILLEAAKALSIHDAVMLPTFDGGYALLGLNAYHPSVFEGIEWSCATVASSTQKRLDELNWNVALLPKLYDIDEPADLQHLPEKMKKILSYKI